MEQNNRRKAASRATSSSVEMPFYLTQADRPGFSSTVELWAKFCSRPNRRTDRQHSQTGGGQVAWGLLRVKTTASVYTPQLPQTCIHFCSRQWEIPASGKCAYVYFNSHTWCFGECLQNMVGDLYIDSSFHKLQLHGAASAELGERLMGGKIQTSVSS